MSESPSELKAEIEKLETRHAENPEGRFFVPLANAYRKSGAVEQAESLLRAGLRQHPDYLSAHIVLGRCLADRGAMPEATAEFQYVLSVDPQNLIALRTLGELAAADGRSDEAARWYEELLAVDPMNEDARRALDALPQPGAPEAPPPPPAPTPAPTGDQGSVLSLDDDELGGPDEGADPGAEVVTETIAELYARQGLHDRAAGVYRELIRRRGGDPALERRLAELSSLAAASADDPAAEPGPPAAAAPEEDPFAASFEHGFDDLPTLAPFEPPAEPPEPEPETEPVALPEPATIAEYLGALAAWTPGSGAPDSWAPASWEPETAVGEPEAGAPPAAAPAAQPPLPAFEEDPWIAGLVLDPAEDPIPGLTRASDGATDPSDGIDFPWELPEEAPAEPAAAEEAGAEELFSFDAFFADTPTAPPAPEPAPEPAPAADAAPAAPQEEEDDLESFQAWLRSLKR